MKALKRAFELKQSGKTWPEVVQALKAEGFRDSKGNPYSVTNVKSLHSKHRDEITAAQLPSEDNAHYEGNGLPDAGMDHSEPMPPAHERSADYEPQKPEAWENRVREIVREEMQSLMNLQNVQPVMPGEEEAPPESKTIKGQGKGRKEPRDYERVTLTLDKELARLFKQEQKRHGISAGKLFDRILWHRYGKPKLSYQTAEDD